MINRVQQIIKKNGLSPAQFADKIQVQRANLSHILNGRNKPSLDFITKILTSYPGINSDWLLFGKGKMETTGNDVAEKISQPAEQQALDLETQKIPPAVDKVKTTISKIEKKQASSTVEKSDKNTQTPASIKKIIIFFTNGIFQEFKGDE